ncbi:MAG TPA: hypothetical protein DCG75_10450 [Bacteroidales bacterium]|jgi:hypothetical protein|nr:hypothetical protein [Bacteroidales bacterium]
MKKTIILLVSIFITGGFFSASAQNKFEKTIEKDGVNFSYKWKPSELFKKDSPLALVIKMENTNDNPVKVTFNVNYYWGMDLKATSNQQEITIKPKKSFTHNVKKQGFDNFSFTNEDLKDEAFNFELVKITVETLPKAK